MVGTKMPPICSLCGKPTSIEEAITEKINGHVHVFDKEDCSLMFKKFDSVYGSEFCMAQVV
jgi:hypothetical protein